MPKRPVEVGTFETLAELREMQAALPDQVLADLRAADRPVLRDRLQAVASSQNRGLLQTKYRFTNTGVHNAPVLVQPGASTRKAEKQVIPYFSRASIWNPTIGAEVAIYGLGIATTLADRTPVFQSPETSMQSIVIVEDDRHDIAAVGTSPITPLFNVYPDGTVHARIHDEPTQLETALFHGVLETFEIVAGLSEA